jgi:uncharacterized protein YuzE
VVYTLNMVNYFYDKEADTFYFLQGAPSASDETIEAGNDVLIQVNPRTKKVRGFTIINASKHNKKSKTSTKLPFEFALKNS